MLKIQCPQCNKSFVWTDNMQVRDKCPTLDCTWHYDINNELKRNLSQREARVEPRTLRCPFCQGEIPSKFTICRNCRQIVLGSKAFRKSSFFLAVCLILIILSLIFKYLVK